MGEGAAKGTEFCWEAGEEGEGKEEKAASELRFSLSVRRGVCVVVVDPGTPEPEEPFRRGMLMIGNRKKKRGFFVFVYVKDIDVMIRL